MIFETKPQSSGIWRQKDIFYLFFFSLTNLSQHKLFIMLASLNWPFSGFAEYHFLCSFVLDKSVKVEAHRTGYFSPQCVLNPEPRRTSSKLLFSKSIPCVWHFNFIFIGNLGVCKCSKSRLEAISLCYKPVLTAVEKEISAFLVVNLQRATFGKNPLENMHIGTCIRIFFFLGEKYPAKSIPSKWSCTGPKGLITLSFFLS